MLAYTRSVYVMLSEVISVQQQLHCTIKLPTILG